MNIKAIYFSASGTTELVARTLATNVADADETAESDITYVDALRDRSVEPIEVPKSELAIFAVPVFAGRVPEACTQQLRRLKGAGGPAVCVVVYGNRDYDDALIELYDIARESGFVPISAGAFVAHHSIFPKVAAGRPDKIDLFALSEFGHACRSAADAFTGNEMLEVKGNRPYLNPKGVPMKPKGDASCNECGICVSLCPAKAIDSSDPRKTDSSRCISCTACIAACPQHARKFGGPIYKVASAVFSRKCAARKQPETFLAH